MSAFGTAPRKHGGGGLGWVGRQREDALAWIDRAIGFDMIPKLITGVLVFHRQLSNGIDGF